MERVVANRNGVSWRKRLVAAVSALLAVVLCASMLPNMAVAAEGDQGNSASEQQGIVQQASVAESVDKYRASEQRPGVAQKSSARASIAKATVSVASTLPYSGKALRPAVTVKLAGKTLKAGTDYTVAYKNNVGSAKGGATSKATVTVTGKGSYTGAVSKAFQVKTPSVQYYVHRQTYGWEAKYSKRDGASSGTTGQRKRLEGIYVRLANKPVFGSIQYRTHVQKIGWQGWRKEGQMAGTTGKKLRLEAIQIKLTGEMAKSYDVYYRVHAQKFGWMGWAKNGAQAGTAGYAYRLESIQIKLVPKGAVAPTSAGGVASTKGKAAFSQKRATSNAGSSQASKPANTKPATSNKYKPTNADKRAVEMAKRYSIVYLSREGMIRQLEYEGYTHSQAVYGADHCGQNWYANAAKKAKSYMNFMPFTKERLIQQLESPYADNFTHDQAVYGANHCGVVW